MQDLWQHHDSLMELTFGSHRKDHKSKLLLKETWRKLCEMPSSGFWACLFIAIG